MENIGLAGARIAVDERVSAGDAVRLSFTAATLWDPLAMQARVVWCDDNSTVRRFGVAFDHVSAQTVFALYELLMTLAYE